jgi:hypothetical protein
LAAIERHALFIADAERADPLGAIGPQNPFKTRAPEK